MCSLFIDLNHHHYILNIDLKKLASQQKSIQMKMKLLALAHFKGRDSRTQIVKFLKVSRTSGNNWVQTFLEEGLEGWQEKPSTGGFEKIKIKIETILNIPEHIALECVDVWFQDEARFGQQNTTTRLWAEKAARPRAMKQ